MVEFVFRDLITLLHSELAFSKAKDSICLICGSDIILYIAEVNLCKNQWRLLWALYNFSKSLSLLSWFFNPVPSIQSSYMIRVKVWSLILICLCSSAYWLSLRSWPLEISIPLALLHCSMTLDFSLHHVFYCNWGSASNIVTPQSFQSYGIILFKVAYDFNIYFTKGECILYETAAFLNIFKSNISTVSQITSE